MEPVEARFLFPKIDVLNEFHLERNNLIWNNKYLLQVEKKHLPNQTEKCKY